MNKNYDRNEPIVTFKTPAELEKVLPISCFLIFCGLFANFIESGNWHPNPW